MRRIVLLAAACGLMLATVARAEVPPASPVAAQPPAADPVKLALARELLEASGGRKAVEARMDAAYDQMGKLVKPLAGEGGAMVQGMLADIRTDMAAHVPELIDATVTAYATVYSEQELRDYLAWLKSPAGRSILAKSAALQQQVMQAQLPIMQAMMSTVVRRVLDRLCAEKSCTPEQRKQLDEIMGKMMGASKS